MEKEKEEEQNTNEVIGKMHIASSTKKSCPEGMQQCTHCKVNRDFDQFIGKTGERVKRCLKCRQNDDKSKSRPDRVAKRNQQQRDAKRYQTYRDKKRNENESEYLAHNAENALKWRQQHLDHVKEWRKQNLNQKLKSIKYSAQERSILWSTDLTDDISFKMMSSPCSYCNYIHEKHLNGIDRVDSKQGYQISNTVSCCKYCNGMKGSLDPQTFLKRCQHISFRFGGKGKEYHEVFPDGNASCYNSYKKRAEKKQLAFLLSKEQFYKYQMSPCYYCGKESSTTHINGVDRKDNGKGYTEDNCVTCCSFCNYLKRDVNDHDFITNCKRLADYQEKQLFHHHEEVETQMEPILKRQKVEIPNEKIVVMTLPPKVSEPIVIPESTSTGRQYTKGTNLPKDSPITSDMIPMYCQYVKETSTRGDGFCVGRLHPKQKSLGKQDWKTTQSKSVSIVDKYKQMMAYLNEP